MQGNKTTSNQILKSINEQKVLRLIFTEGPISRVKLANRTGLTQQTITNIVKRFLNKELVLEMNPTSNAHGRKPIPLVVNSKHMYAIGIEVAVKYVRGSLMDFHQNLIKEIKIEVPKFEGEEHPMRYIYQVIDQLLEFVPAKGDLIGIGCGIQGLVDSNKGVVIYSPGLGWNQFPLKENLEKKYMLPIYLENDANLFALVENFTGSLEDSVNNITLKFDYGIGGAIVLNKKLYSGSTHVAGELGHYKAFTEENAKQCHCGAKGCLTTLASISGLRRNTGLSMEEFREKIDDNNPEAVKLFDTVSDAIISAVSNLITFFNPDHVLIGGEVIEQLNDILLPQLKVKVMEMIPESCQGVTLLYLNQNQKSNESTLAVGLVMDRFFGVPLDRLSLQFSKRGKQNV